MNDIGVIYPGWSVRPVAGRVGAEISGVRLDGDMPERTVGGIRRALNQHKVLFFRGQDHLDDDEQEAFGRRLGDIIWANTAAAYRDLPKDLRGLAERLWGVRQTSALAIYPIFILLLGLGETSKVAIIGWAAFFPVLLNTISGVKLVDRRLIEMARIFGASRTQVFRRVVLPAATPAIFVGLRLSATISLLLLVAAEMIGAKQGLGFLIINSQYNFEIPTMFAAIVLLASIGLAVNYALLFAQGRLCRWENPRTAKPATGEPG